MAFKHISTTYTNIFTVYVTTYQYADELYGPEDDPLSLLDSSEGSEAEAEAKAGSDHKAHSNEGPRERERRFSSMSSGAKHVVFIRCSSGVDPTQLVHTMLSDIHTTKTVKSR